MSEKHLSLKALMGRDREILDILKENDILLRCRNSRTGRETNSRFSVLFRNNNRFWELENWEFSLRAEDGEALVRLLAEKKNLIKGDISALVLEERAGLNALPAYGREYDEVEKMSLGEREKRLEHSIETLDEALNQPKISSHDMASLMTDAAIYSTIINKVSIEEMQREENLVAKRELLQITEKTETLMTSFVEALSRNYNLNHTAETIIEQTTGVTSRHMTRVFLLSIRFLDDVRLEFESAGLYKRLHGRMKSYLPLYEPLRERYPLARFDASFILPEPIRFKQKKMEEIMLGILLHDLGKNRNLLYFDGETGYDREIIEKHAFDGFRMVKEKTVYGQAIASVAGLHHEYYGHEQGYGVFRRNYSEYRRKFPDHSFDAVLTNEYNDVVSFKSLAFFPAKILEIVDVYDALIDRERRYKEPMSPGEALAFMRKTMIDESLKLDPILFDLFVKFLKKAKLI